MTKFTRLPRDEERKRYALQRALPRAMRAISRGTGWRCAQGVLFRTLGDWFVSAGSIAWISEYRTRADFHAKPMALDPIFWDLVGIPENRNLPLSFRCFGAWTCRPPPLAEDDILEGDREAAGIAARTLEWADTQLRKFEGRWTAESFLDHVRDRPNAMGYSATLVCMLILTGKLQEALAICEGMKARGDPGGFMIAGGSAGTFPELAIEWLTGPRPHGLLQ